MGTLSLAIQWRGAIPEGSHSYSHQQIGFIRRLLASANTTYYDLTVVNTYPYILFPTPLNMPLMQLLYKALQKHSIPFRFQTLSTLNEALTLEQGVQQIFHLPYQSQAAGHIECLNTLLKSFGNYKQQMIL